MSSRIEENVDLIGNLASGFSELLEHELNSQKDILDAMIAVLRLMQDEQTDVRLGRLVTELKKLSERSRMLNDIAERDHFAKILDSLEEIRSDLASEPLATILDSLVSLPSPTLQSFCSCLLDGLLKTTNAERGFILSYSPVSATADVIAARNFQTTNLSLAEYEFSRTILRDVFEQNSTLIVADASQDIRYAGEASVQSLELRSVISAPLRHDQETIGALYLENNSLPKAFDRSDERLLESVARFVVFYFYHARLLPLMFQQPGPVFLDTSRASKVFISQDAKTLELLDIVGRIADSPAAVLLQGESGTGKELIARALHYQSARADQPFVAINCAAIPDNLLESELFGHEKGAFTGATEKYIGLIEQANGGTLLLDEVSEVPLQLQAKLLRFLQSSEFHRLGSKKQTEVDVRIVSATSKDLKKMTANGLFQEALYYRLNVIPLRLPPLRERKADVHVLTDHFLAKFSSLYRKNIQIERAALECLQEYDFPGNVRELEHLIHRLVALSTDDRISLGDLPPDILRLTTVSFDLNDHSLSALLATQPSSISELHRRRKAARRIFSEQEKRLIEKTILESGGSLTEAANRLGIHRVTLHKLRKKGIEDNA